MQILHIAQGDGAAKHLLAELFHHRADAVKRDLARGIEIQVVDDREGKTYDACALPFIRAGGGDRIHAQSAVNGVPDGLRKGLDGVGDILAEQLCKVDVESHVKGIVHDGQVDDQVVLAAVEDGDPLVVRLALLAIEHLEQDLGTIDVAEVQVGGNVQHNVAHDIVRQGDGQVGTDARNADAVAEQVGDEAVKIVTTRRGRLVDQGLEFHRELHPNVFKVVEVAEVGRILEHLLDHAAKNDLWLLHRKGDGGMRRI